MTELTFTTTSLVDGLMLFGRSYQIDNPKAVLSLVHGLGEHSGRYQKMANWLNEHGIAVNLIDLRGHGQSMGKRGGAKNIDLMLDDIASLMEYTRNSFPDVPHHLMGHSMGGLLVLAYGLQRPLPDIKSVISQAPALRPVKPVPPSQLSALKFIRPIWAGFTASNGLDPDAISKDADVVKAYLDDPMVHDKISVSLALDLINTGERCLAEAGNWEKPLLLLHGAADTITSHEASETFAKAAGEKCEAETIPGGYHEIHNDPEREAVYQKIADYILA